MSSWDRMISESKFPSAHLDPTISLGSGYRGRALKKSSKDEARYEVRRYLKLEAGFTVDVLSKDVWQGQAWVYCV